MADVDGPREVTVRNLTAREIATIRAALRLWIETPAGTMPERVLFESGDDPPITDEAIEHLLRELSMAGGVMVTTSVDAPDRQSDR